MENYIPVSNAILSYCIYPYLTPNELHRTNVLCTITQKTTHNYSRLFDVHAEHRFGKCMYKSIKKELVHLGIYDTMVYLVTCVPTDTRIPKKISKELCLSYTPNINDILYSASIWSSSRPMYNNSCYICHQNCSRHKQKQQNIEKVLHRKYMKYPSLWFLKLNNKLTKHLFTIGKTLLTKRIDENNLYTIFDIFLKGSTYVKMIYPELNNWLYHSIDVIHSQYNDQFMNYEFVIPTKHILSNIHEVICKYMFKKYFTIFSQNTSS